MKTMYLLVMGLCLTVMVQAQVSKTVEVIPGNLALLLTGEEKNRITNLTLTGTMDARDFKTMRDEMPLLSEVDLSHATIAAYTGDGGPSGLTTRYPADGIPAFAFYDPSRDATGHKILLKSVLIPVSTRTIGASAFLGCGLTSFDIPSLVTVIYPSAFNSNKNLNSIAIPASVQSIGKSAFSDCIQLVSLAISSSVDSIQHSTFRFCTGLVKVDIPSSVKFIGDYAFSECRSLESVTVPSSVASIGVYTFFNCISLHSLKLPPGIASIGSGSFSGCTSITGPVILPQGLSSIKMNTFSECSSLANVVIPSSVDSIEYGAFAGCTNLRELILPSALKYIGAFAFSECGLIGTLSLPAALTTIEGKAFNGCMGLTGELIIPPLVTAIKDGTFYGCMGLTSLAIPPTVTVIERTAFGYCSGLTSLTIPSSITSIGPEAFLFCTSLTSIDVRHLFPLSLYSATNVFAGIDKTTTILHVPFGTKERYATADKWSDFETIVEDEMGFLLNSSTLYLDADGASVSTLEVTADFAWTATAGQPWLTVSPSSGDHSQTLTITAEANPETGSRSAMITLSAEGIPSQIIRVSQAPIPFKVNTTPGGLSTALTIAEQKTITHLVITGTIDARDFKTMNYMPLLTAVDMSQVDIAAYELVNEIEPKASYFFSENAFPGKSSKFVYSYSLTDKTGLTSLILPASIVSIQPNAFLGCTGLTSIVVPPSVESIGMHAFKDCTQLTNCSIPASVTSIGEAAFYACISLDSIELPNGLTTLSDSIFSECKSLKNISVPSQVVSIGIRAFSGCSSLESMVIPRSVTSIGQAAFMDCKNLTSLYTQGLQPVDLSASADVFSGLNTATCLLYVPYGTSGLYAAAPEWEKFETIIEMPGFMLSATKLRLKSNQVEAKVEITSNVTWTVTCDQTWLSINPGAGTGDQMLTFTTDSNTSVIGQSAIVTLSAAGIISQDINVIHEGLPKTINLTAGTLATELTIPELNGINNLIITGNMDARDFKTIRDQMPALSVLDLTGATITGYEGTEGTLDRDEYYQANQIPSSAFFSYPSGQGKANLICVLFPASLTSIGPHAFRNCPDLTSASIPASVTSIGQYAFRNCPVLASLSIPESVVTIGYEAFAFCKSLTSVTIPPAVTNLEYGLFLNCTGLTSVDIPSTVTTIGEGVFSGCKSLTSVTLPSAINRIEDWLFSNCTALTSIDIPQSVTSIGQGAFSGCKNLSSITIPVAVYLIGDAAFSNCSGLISLFAHPVFPPDVTYSYNVFDEINRTSCTLYVPYGAKVLYADTRWSYFNNIVEMTELEVSATEATLEPAQGSSASITIYGNADWTIRWDQPWLEVNPVTGTGDQAITITADEVNTSTTARIATMTVSAAEIEAQVIVTQLGIATGVEEINQNRPAWNCYPNPFTQEVTIEIQNPKRAKVTVDIYNMAGQKIKNLASGNNSIQLNLKWYGTNDQGQKVPAGMYLCKMNQRYKQLVFGGL